MLDLRPIGAPVVAIKAIADATILDENSVKVGCGELQQHLCKQ